MGDDDPRDASPAAQQPVADVHDRLRRAILGGRIPAGQVTTQTTLARDLGVGRTPLREALRMLQREGLIVSEPHRSVRIAALSGADAEELYVMRIALEAVAIRLTVPALTSADVAGLEGFMAQMDHYMRLRDPAGLRGPHRAFHAGLVVHSGDRVRAMIAQLFDHAERYRTAFGATTPDEWDQRRAEHRSILDAAAECNVEAAARELIGHYARTAALIFRALDPDHDLAHLRTTIQTVAPGAESALSAR